MSDLLSSDVVVGGHSFRLQKIPAKRASLLFNRLMRLFAPTLAQITGTLSKKFRLRDLMTSETNTLAPTLMQFFTTFTEEEQSRLFDDLFENVRWKNSKSEWLELRPFVDECFTGHTADMFKLLIECIKFQFSDFKDAFTAALNASKANTAENSQDQIPMQ